ncbi:class I adenylate-forming enzyme family protein [Aquihabitans sp. McL0605]|uniref:class I adenylate-forming enzyme family protein n=1 Tax=Aquihabitans sp. McL0605 TaxID=3415671 RepID=UPI003CEFFC6B
MRIVRRIDLARGRNLTLGTLMEQVAAVHGSRTLVVEPDTGLALTMEEAAVLVDGWAAGVAQVTEPGDRVVIATPNGYEQLLLTLAVSRAGRVPAPVNAQMAPGEIRHVVADSGASLVIRHATELPGTEHFGPAVPADPSSIGALFYTSGTTGKPKGAELTHAGLLGGMSLAALLPTELHRDELVLALPLAHIFGFAIAVGAACAGVPVHFLPRFHPVLVLDAIEERRATVFAGVPAMYRMLEEAGAAHRDLTSVRVWISGADAMPSDLAHRFKRWGATATLPLIGPVGEATFAEGYGMVETAGGVAVRVSPPLIPAALGGSMGVPLPGVRFKVVDADGQEVPIGGVGELWLTGRGVLKGYHGAPEATRGALTDDGWLRTGDLARRGPLGIVNFEGRMKDVIKRGGYSVYAVEVEQALEEHPQVLEAAVVPVPDTRDGEVPVAAVRLAPGETVESLDLPSWAAERLSRYKVPARFVAVAALPRTGTDKVQRREVVALVTE